MVVFPRKFVFDVFVWMTDCRRQAKPRNEELPTAQTSSSTIQPPVYANIEHSPQSASGNTRDDLQRETTSTDDNHQANGAVLYSELQSNDAHRAAPSGDLYTHVQKRWPDSAREWKSFQLSNQVFYSKKLIVCLFIQHMH